MRAGKSKTGPRRTPQTAAYSVVGEWLKRESQRISNLETAGDLDKVSPRHTALVNALNRVLDEHDKLLKYCRIVVRCHENRNFEENVNAILIYLVEELGVEP